MAAQSETGLALVASPPPPLTLDPRRAALASDPFEPQSMEEMYKFAALVAGTDFAPKDFRGKPEACMVAMIFGRNLGIGALQSIQNISVINSRPSIWGELFWAVIVSHPEFVDCVEDVTDERAEVVLTRRNRTPKKYTFSMTDAKVAGLKDKSGPWTNYPKGQMLWRARHNAATALFADALKGIAPREIVQDFIEGDVSTLRPEPAFSAAALTSAPAVVEKGDQAKPAEETKPVADPDPMISADQVKEWNAARKAGGWSTDEARMYIEHLTPPLKRSGEMRVSQFPAAMAWAKARPNPATAPDPADDGPAKSSPAEAQCREWMVALEMDLFAQDRLVSTHTSGGSTDWGRVAMALEPDLKHRGVI